MSTITSLAIIGVIVVFGFPVLGTYLGAEIDQNAQALQDKQDAKDFGNNAKVGDIVCDLYIKVTGELDESRDGGFALFDSAVVYFDDGWITYEWQENSCYSVGSNSLVPLIAYDFAPGSDLQTNSILPTVTLGDSFDLELTGDYQGKLLTAKGTEKRWVETVSIKDFEVVDLPIRFTEEFFLRGVVIADYNLEFRAIEQSINDMDTNDPMRYTILAPSFR